MIFTSISPNTEPDDVRLAWKSLFTPWNWKQGKYIGELEQTFAQKFSLPNAYAFQSGRNALYAILKSLELNGGDGADEVLLQAYTCVAVPEPVLWVGVKPVYVDILPDLTMDPEDLKKKITLKSKVLIIQHTFGIPAHMDELLAIAREHNLFVIEDCAHAMGVMYKNKYVGTFGDASFFSFGRDKVLSSVFGGILSVKNSELAKKVEALRNTFSYPSLFRIKRELMHPLVMSFSKKTYNFLYIGKIKIEILKRIGYIPKAVERAEYSGGKPSFFAQKMPDVLAKLALHQFAKIDRYHEHRDSIVALYKKELEVSGIGWLRYTIFVGSPAALIRKAKVAQIELGDWYQQSIAPKWVDYGKIGYDPALCPQAEKYASQSVNLPTHIGISEEDALKIISVVKAAK